MSVYKPARTRLWLYDFQHKGQRFHGSTGQESRRAAETYERNLRVKMAEGGASAIQQTVDTSPREMTLDTAIGKWWYEYGSGLGSADDQEAHLDHWNNLIGRNKKLGAIKLSTIRTAIAKRRAIPYRGKLPSTTTINRFIAALRMVWNYVDDEDDPLPAIKWRKLTSTENNTRVREMTDSQYDAVLVAADARADWGALFVDVLATYGPRMGEMFVGPECLEPAHERWRIPKAARKRPVDLVLTLSSTHTAALAARQTRALAADLPHLWYDDVGKLRPVSRDRANYLVRAALADAGLVDFHIHDLRHHAATRLLRATDNLSMVKAALGHASIQSTMRYAHIQESDLRAGFARLSRNSPEASNADKAKAQGALGKAKGK